MDDLIKKYKKHIISAFNINCNIFNVYFKEFDNPSEIYCENCNRQCDYKNTHLYGCYEAVRWDNKYIYYCPCGYIFIAVPVYDEQAVLRNGIITGPILMGNSEDFTDDTNVPNLPTSKVNDIAEIISAIFSPKLKATEAKESTEEFLNTIYKELEVLSDDGYYPIQLEKELQASIIDRNSKHSRELLNKLLGQIFFHSNGDFKKIKARALELIVLLSRSAIEGGANVRQIFNLNDNYINEVESFETLEQLSTWLTGVINRFVSYVFEFGDVKHADTIYKATAYIKSNYMKKLTLDNIAEHVFLSKTYLSKIFNEEMNITLSGYINKIRVEKSKVLLLDSSLTIADVANLVGFEDQSYFSKTFKSLTNISPGKYKEKHGKV